MERQGRGGIKGYLCRHERRASSSIWLARIILVTVHFVDVPVVGKPQSWLREVGYRPLMAVSKCPAKTVNAQLNCSCSRAFKCSIRTASSYNTLKLSML
ncbi:hypothetical protein MUK42_00081 [Musa troglodytarum]|uniref:Uncharacterized protein n=1 Tax=Musa troglodytarum TaxID=320322 RepID=A0A9E7K1T1_9LILI|nr:hypothetical protein MUK42_00081 [Musa troglodytarum]